MILQQDINDSLEIIYRYEKFLFFRNWGIVLLSFGIIESINSIFNLINISLQIFDSESLLWNFLQIIGILFSFLILIVVMKSFYYSKETKIVKKKIIVVKKNVLGILFIIIWFISFILLRLVFFDPIFANRQSSFISPLLVSGLMFIGSYFVVKHFFPYFNNKEFLIVGLALIQIAIISFVITQQYIDPNPFAPYDNPFDFLRDIMKGDSSDIIKQPNYEFFYFHTLISAISFIILGIIQMLKGNHVLREVE